MLDKKYILENEEAVKANLRKRGQDYSVQITELCAMEKSRKTFLQRVEKLRFERKALQEAFCKSKTDEIKAQLKQFADDIKGIDEQLAVLTENIEERLLNLPNLLHHKVPMGSTSRENTEVAVEPKDMAQHADSPIVPHWEIHGTAHSIDLERGAKIAGARFAFLKGDFARLERALIQFMLDTQGQNGYTEIVPPYMVNYQSMMGTGQFPKFLDDAFKVEGRDLYLIPTAEVPLVNMFANETFEEKDLDISMMAFTPCFRAEAGSYGIDTKGLIRQHQFHKVELVKIAHPDRSDDALEKILADARKILDLLVLPYRVMILCSGDTGFAASMTYDIEVWIQSQHAFREISSVSNCSDFQARRANIRFKPQDAAAAKKTAFVHTLNGSGLAIGRTLISLVEYYQDGPRRIVIPDVLRPYMNDQASIEW